MGVAGTLGMRLDGRGATVAAVLPIGYIRRATAWGAGLVDFSCHGFE